MAYPFFQSLLFFIFGCIVTVYMVQDSIKKEDKCEWHTLEIRTDPWSKTYSTAEYCKSGGSVYLRGTISCHGGKGDWRQIRDEVQPGKSNSVMGFLPKEYRPSLFFSVMTTGVSFNEHVDDGMRLYKYGGTIAHPAFIGIYPNGNIALHHSIVSHHVKLDGITFRVD